MGLAELISGKCSFIEPCWESENNQPLKKKKKKKWRCRYSDPDRERLGEQAMINTKI